MTTLASVAKRLTIAGAVILGIAVLAWVALAASGMGGLMIVTYLFTPTDRIDPQAELRRLDAASNPNRRVVHPESRNKRCLLLHVVEYGTAEHFRELLRNGATPIRCDGGSDRLLDALLLRAAVQHIGFVDGPRNLRLDSEFLEVCREFSVRPTNIQRFLSEAARRQSIDGVAYAVRDLGANPNHIGDEFGNTPLHWALKADGGVTDRSIAVVDALVKLGADPNFGISEEKSSLSWARTHFSTRSFWSRLERAMLPKQSAVEMPSNTPIEADARKSGARPSL